MPYSTALKSLERTRQRRREAVEKRSFLCANCQHAFQTLFSLKRHERKASCVNISIPVGEVTSRRAESGMGPRGVQVLESVACRDDSYDDRSPASLEAFWRDDDAQEGHFQQAAAQDFYIPEEYLSSQY